MSRDSARALRRNATEAERLLWRSLSLFKHHGFHFRRQVPMGPYIADFACHRAKLIVELDGGQHNETSARVRDRVRTAFLEGRGYLVFRVWNNELFADPVAVGEHIFAIAQERAKAPSASCR